MSTKAHSHDHDHSHAGHDHSHDGHDHSHGIGHSHAHNAPVKVLLWAVAITFGFAAIEAIAGWWSHALVLLSDAGHMASDSLALAIAAFAAWVSSRPPSAKHSYGFGRAEVIGAWFSSLLMVVVVIYIIIEAIERFDNPHVIAGGWVMIVGFIGMVLNLAIAWILSRGEKTLNVRAAVLHVMSDVLGSIAALITGAVIYFKGWTMIDPILSIFICILILFSSLQLLRESLVVLMEGVPLHIDLTEVGKKMATIAKVKSVHDLHIWTLSSGVISLSAHIEINDMHDWDNVLKDLRELLAHRFKIKHITLQPEVGLEIIQPQPFR